MTAPVFLPFAVVSPPLCGGRGTLCAADALVIPVARPCPCPCPCIFPGCGRLPALRFGRCAWAWPGLPAGPPFLENTGRFATPRAGAAAGRPAFVPSMLVREGCNPGPRTALALLSAPCGTRIVALPTGRAPVTT